MLSLYNRTKTSSTILVIPTFWYFPWTIKSILKFFYIHEKCLMCPYWLNQNLIRSQSDKCWVLQLLIGLSYLHGKCRIIHTDLKPENVLICTTEDSLVKMAADAIREHGLNCPLPLYLGYFCRYFYQWYIFRMFDYYFSYVYDFQWSVQCCIVLISLLPCYTHNLNLLILQNYGFVQGELRRQVTKNSPATKHQTWYTNCTWSIINLCPQKKKVNIFI